MTNAALRDRLPNRAPMLNLVVVMSAMFSVAFGQTNILVGTSPYAAAVNPVTNKIYVINSDSSSVTVIDGATNSTSTVAVGQLPISVALNPVTNKIYVVNGEANNVTVIDGATSTTFTVFAGVGPCSVAVNPLTNKIYVANSGNGKVTVIDGATNSTATLAAGNTPYSVAVNPVTNKIYVANADGDNVTVIDGATNSTATVAAGARPYAVAVNPVTNKIYVANLNSANVTVIDGATNSTATVAAGVSPFSVAVNPVTNKIYVANLDSANVTVIDGATNSSATVAVGAGPHSVAMNPVTNKIYVANGISANVTMIDGATNSTATLAAGKYPHSVAVNPVTNKIYIANRSSSNTTVIDGATNSTDTIAAGSSPISAAVNPVTNKIYVANSSSANVTVIDGATNSTATVAAGSHPMSVAVNLVTNKIYVANSLSDNVTVIDSATNSTATVAAGAFPFSVAVNPVTNKIYVANRDSANVTVIDGATNSTATVAAGNSPVSVAVNPVTNKIYVANANSGGSVTVIDGATNSKATVAAGAFPISVAVNPVTNKIYVANSSSANVTVIDGATNANATVAVGSHPTSVAVNLVTNKIYVANVNSGNVTVIDGATNSTATVAAGNSPVSVAVNPVTNKIYVANQGSLNVTVIDGTTSSTATVAAGTYPTSVAVNPVTNKIYVVNQGSANVTAITEQQVQPIPLTTSITPFAGNQTANSRPTFTFAASSTFSPTATTPDRVFYQADTWQGAWSESNASNGSYTGKLAALPVGFHILYAYAGDGQEATSTQAVSPLTGNIQAYGFLVLHAPPVPLTQTITFNAITGVTYGIVPFQLTASASSSLPVTYTGGVANVCSVTATGLMTILGAGQCSVTANQAGDEVYVPAASVTQTFIVTAKLPSLTVTMNHNGNFFTGQTGVTYTITVSNSAMGGATTGDPITGRVDMADGASQANLTNISMAGAGWSCMGNICSRSDVLQPGASYQPITVTANVAATASFTNQATLSYGGSVIATAVDPTTIQQIQLSLALTHASNFAQGQTNAHYLFSITNTGTSAVSGIVLGDNLPTSLTVASPSLLFWSCIGSGCTLNNQLTVNAGATITVDLYVNVAANAPASVTNQATLMAPVLAQPVVANDVTGIDPIAAKPTLVPTSGTGSTQAFTFTFPSAGGYQNLAGAQIVINSALSAVNSCYVLFARPDVISLAADSGSAFQSTSLGAPAVLQNSQCVVLASLTTQSGSGNTETLTLNVVFKASFAGPKTVWANYNTNAGVSAGYQQLGTYTATAPQSGFGSSVTPASGQGQAQAFTFRYFDAYGAPDISGAQVAFNSALSGANACYILLSAANSVSLASDDASTFNTAVLGQQSVLQNSQCTVFPGLSYQTQSGQTLSFTVFVAFKPDFTGSKNIYSSVNNNAGTSSGFSTLGTWNVTGNPGLSPTSVYPSAASGPSQALTFVFADPNGASDIKTTELIINPTGSGTANSCLILFTPATGNVLLFSDDGQGTTSANLGQAAVVQNSQCIVNVAASSQVSSGTYMTLTLFLTMKKSGLQNIYSFLHSPTLGDSALSQVGTWNVTSPAVMTPVSVTPLTGAGPAGSQQFLTFTLSNPAGASDTSGALIVLYPSLQGANGCYILWGHDNNLLSLASDNVQSFSSGTLGSAGLLSNSQCTVDPLQSFVVQTGNTVNLTVAVSFKAVYKQFGQIYSWVNVQNQAHALSGWFVESRFTVQ